MRLAIDPIVHESYGFPESISNDIALLKLAEAVDLDQGVRKCASQTREFLATQDPGALGTEKGPWRPEASVAVETDIGPGAQQRIMEAKKSWTPWSCLHSIGLCHLNI